MLPTGERLGCDVLLIFQLYSTFSAKIKALRRCKRPIPGISGLHFRHAWLTGRLVAGSRVGGELRLELVGHVLPGLGVGRRLLLLRDIGPDFRKISVEFEEVLQSRLGVRLDRVDRAFGFAHAAIDALVGMDDEHVLPHLDAIPRRHSYSRLLWRPSIAGSQASWP